MPKLWYVYILQCADATYYTGISPDVKQRVETHNLGKASRYTRVRLPVEIVYIEQCEDRSEASKREAEIKKLSKQKKLELMDSPRWAGRMTNEGGE
ncbi:MAG: GIY-YIG nuclease family protein [Patescibacteria group bacterium]|nr:GIY-YIG nuclease family protein [Patescibacteria group bacterium]